jgi:hypothetical protein
MGFNLGFKELKGKLIKQNRPSVVPVAVVV